MKPEKLLGIVGNFLNEKREPHELADYKQIWKTKSMTPINFANRVLWKSVSRSSKALDEPKGSIKQKAGFASAKALSALAYDARDIGLTNLLFQNRNERDTLDALDVKATKKTYGESLESIVNNFLECNAKK